MIAVSAITAAQILSLSCTVEPPRNVVIKDDSVTSKTISLPPEMNRWNFNVSIGKDRPAKVALDWPGDPILAGNATSAVRIGPSDYSFISSHPGPCLFTNTSCVFMYTVSVHDDGTADILIQPSAIFGPRDGRREPFQVFMKGRCVSSGAAK